MSLGAVSFGHQNLVMRIHGAIKLYDFHVHVQGDILFIRYNLKNSVDLARG